MKRFAPSLAVLAGVLFTACAPADVAGNYSINVTNGPDECMGSLGDWMEGNTASAIPVLVTQDGDQVALEVQGLTGTALNLVVGSNRFSGQVGGNDVTAALIGDNTGRQGECAFTVTVDLDATVSGDLIQGTLRYRPVTNGHPDCGILETCSNTQSFNGARPPGS